MWGDTAQFTRTTQLSSINCHAVYDRIMQSSASPPTATLLVVALLIATDSSNLCQQFIDSPSMQSYKPHSRETCSTLCPCTGT